MSTQRFEVEPGVELNIEIDDYTDPWRQTETIVLAHGFCESGEAWRPWVPQLARRYRVVRPDQRGFGRAPRFGMWAGIETMTADIEAAASMIRARHPGIPAQRSEAHGAGCATGLFTARGARLHGFPQRGAVNRPDAALVAIIW